MNKMLLVEKMGATIAGIMMLAVFFAAIIGIKVSAETTECPAIRSLEGMNVRHESVNHDMDYVVHIWAADGCEHTIYINEEDMDDIEDRLMEMEGVQFAVLAPPAMYEPVVDEYVADVIETTSAYYYSPSRNLN